VHIQSIGNSNAETKEKSDEIQLQLNSWTLCYLMNNARHMFEFQNYSSIARFIVMLLLGTLLIRNLIKALVHVRIFCTYFAKK